MGFNKYKFIDDLKEEINDEIKNDNLQNEDDITEYIHNSVDSECIYYSNCMEIMQELNLYSWDNFDGDCANVMQVAYYGLEELIYNEIDISEFKTK